MAHKHVFTPEEVELLRNFARKLREERGLTTTQLGELMGVEQQNASTFTKPGATGGISRITANRLAQADDLRDAEELLLVLKARAGILEEVVGNVWHSREAARRVAEAMGVAREAIDAVIAQRKAPADARRPVKWWVYQFAHQELLMQADREVRR